MLSSAVLENLPNQHWTLPRITLNLHVWQRCYCICIVGICWHIMMRVWTYYVNHPIYIERHDIHHPNCAGSQFNHWHNLIITYLPLRDRWQNILRVVKTIKLQVSCSVLCLPLYSTP